MRISAVRLCALTGRQRHDGCAPVEQLSDFQREMTRSRRDTAVRQRLFQLCSMQLPAQKRMLLAKVLGMLGTTDARSGWAQSHRRYGHATGPV
jgi:hypothetical protein